MKKLLLVLLALLSCTATLAQTKPATPAAGKPAPGPAVQARNSTSFDLAEYGVSFQPDPRLIVVMAALDAAGFDPTPAGREPSFFRTQVRKDLAGLDPQLRQRMRTFYERTKLPARPGPQMKRPGTFPSRTSLAQRRTSIHRNVQTISRRSVGSPGLCSPGARVLSQIRN